MSETPVELNPAVNSSALENVLEHVFLAELLQEAWFGRRQVVDVLHTSVDAFGYDVALQLGGVMRHVQLKARKRSGRQTRVKLNSLLSTRPSGCVIWMGWDQVPDSNRLSLDYRWFGGAPGAPLPELGDVVAKHSKANAEGDKQHRPGIRIVNLGRFERLHGTADVLDRLFGANPS